MAQETVTLTFTDPNDLSEDASEIEVEVTYNSWYTPGKWTLRNGDPGYPDESGVEFVDWEVINENKPEWLNEDMVIDKFYEYID